VELSEVMCNVCTIVKHVQTGVYDDEEHRPAGLV